MTPGETTTIFSGAKSALMDSGEETRTTAEETRTIDLENRNNDQLTPEQIREMINSPEYKHITDYNELHTIGLGGFGAIYGARERELNRKLALKILRPRFRQSAERVRAVIREAQSTALIEHPNIVPVHHLGYFDDAGIYFSMKRVSGENLRTILRKLNENAPGYRRKYTLTRLLDIFLGTCRGVAYAHYNGLVHCDLKPENLMVGNFGEVLVMDWGMAHYVPKLDKTGNRVLAAAHKDFSQLGGTPVFMAPEHLSLSSKEPSAASDIYSLGCILYTILTWKSSPFNPNVSLEDVQKQVVRGKLTPPHRVAPKGQIPPRELEAICLKAMSRKPENRYQSVEELIADIQNYRDNRPVKAYSPSFLYVFGKILARHPLIPYTLLFAFASWLGVTLYGAVQQRIEERTLRAFAVQNFQNGENRLKNVYRDFRQVGNVQNIKDARKIEARINVDIAEAEGFYNSALEFLSRTQEQNLKNPTTVMLVQRIFHNLARFYLFRGDDQGLYRLAEAFSLRWKKLFDAAASSSTMMRRMRFKILENRGRLQIVTNRDIGKSLQLLDRHGRSRAPVNVWKEGNYWIYDYTLFCGQYRYRMTLRNGVASEGPVSVGSTRIAVLSLIEPEKIPDGMVFIPGGRLKYSSQLSRYITDDTTVFSFLMKKNEVTIKEYLEFWRALSPEEKIDYAGYYMRSMDTLYTRRIWDEKGNIMVPSMTENHPVTGISAKAAVAYCRYLSKKLGMTVQLPTQGQWLKAAYGTDAREKVQKADSSDFYKEKISRTIHPAGAHKEDVSVYGVNDMFGNVREFIRLSGFNVQRYGVIGNSYSTPVELRGQQDVIFTKRGSGETGFRYVIEIPDSGKIHQIL